MVLILAASINYQLPAQPDPGKTIHKSEADQSSGEDFFLKHAEHCLSVIEQAAQKLSVQGVAVVAYLPGEISSSWISKMKVVGALTNGKANYLAVACSKAAEMADTHINSGSASRDPMHGEFGYQGGIIKKVHDGYILAVFSGGTGEQDAAFATEGLDWLNAQYE